MNRWATLAFALLLFATAGETRAGKVYLGAGAGRSDAALGDGSSRVSFDATGYKGFVGYDALRFLSVEAGYTDFGSLDATVGTSDYEAELRIAALWAIGVLPVSPRFEIYARLGYTSWETSVTERDGGEPRTDDGDGNDLGWGFGMAYNITRRWGLRLDWESYELDRADDVSFTSLAVRFRF